MGSGWSGGSQGGGGVGTTTAPLFSRIHTSLISIWTAISQGWVQIKHGVTLSNIVLPNNLLLNSYFENPTVKFYVLYVLNIHANFHANQM